MDKRVIEALVEEDVGTKKTRYDYTKQNKSKVLEIIEDKLDDGIPCKYEVSYDKSTETLVLIEPDYELTESELALLAQLKCNKTLRKLIDRMDDVETIKNILIFFCVLTCISLAVALIAILSTRQSLYLR